MSPEARARLVDVGVAVAVAVVLMLRAAVPFEEGSPEPDWRVYSLMGLFGAVMLWRRRYPVGILLASVVLFQAYYLMGFGAIGAIWPVAPALFNAALCDRTPPAVMVAAGVLAGSGVWRLGFEPESDLLAVFNDMVSEAILASAVILAGSLVASRRKLAAEMQQREQAAASERDAVAGRRISDERLRIAREVHDVVAHSLAGIGVQARLAEELVDTDRPGARQALRAVIDATADAMSRLRQTVGSLRGAPAEATPPTVTELVDATRGVHIDLGDVADLSGHPAADAVIRSVVREALTNVVRHAGAENVVITVERVGRQATVEVIDDGRGGGVAEGNGLRGMRERVRSVGGSLEAGPLPGGGFRVRAQVPL